MRSEMSLNVGDPSNEKETSRNSIRFLEMGRVIGAGNFTDGSSVEENLAMIPPRHCAALVHKTRKASRQVTSA